MPEPALRASLELDARRLGRISDAERDLLRDEWLLAQGQGDGSRMVSELLARIGRLEGTVKELGRALAAVPDWRKASPPPPSPPPTPANDAIALYGVAAALALAGGALGFWWGRRRLPRAEPADMPDAEEPESLHALAPRRPTAVPPGLTSGPDATASWATPSVTTPSVATPSVATTRPALPDLPASELPAADVAAPIPDMVAPEGMIEFDAAPPEPDMDATIVLQSPFAARLSAERDAPDAGLALAAKFQSAAVDLHPAPASEPAPPAGGVFASSADTLDEDGQALELAEIMLSMGLASGAAQTLTEHIRANPKRALYHWLKLLDIHRKTGDDGQFESAANELRQYFNIQAEGWAPTADGNEPTLESYGRIITQVQATWRQPAECLAYLSQLLEDNRGGTRMGFPRPVAEEILLLHAVLKLSV